MATVNIGNLTFTHKGDYDGSTAYVKNDVVYYSTNGNTYILNKLQLVMLQLMELTGRNSLLVLVVYGTAGLSLGLPQQKLRVNSSGNSALEFYTPAVTSENVEIVGYTAFDGTGVNTHYLDLDKTIIGKWIYFVFIK